MRDFESKMAKKVTYQQTEKHKHLNKVNRPKLIFKSSNATTLNKVGRSEFHNQTEWIKKEL